MELQEFDSKIFTLACSIYGLIPATEQAFIAFTTSYSRSWMGSKNIAVFSTKSTAVRPTSFVDAVTRLASVSKGEPHLNLGVEMTSNRRVTRDAGRGVLQGSNYQIDPRDSQTTYMVHKKR